MPETIPRLSPWASGMLNRLTYNLEQATKFELVINLSRQGRY
jgi:hypothetical protein